MLYFSRSVDAHKIVLCVGTYLPHFTLPIGLSADIIPEKAQMYPRTSCISYVSYTFPPFIETVETSSQLLTPFHYLFPLSSCSRLPPYPFGFDGLWLELPYNYSQHVYPSPQQHPFPFKPHYPEGCSLHALDHLHFVKENYATLLMSPILK